MTHKKAVKLLSDYFYPDPYRPPIKLSDRTLSQIFQALERFDHATKITVHNDALIHSDEHTLFAVPKNPDEDYWEDYDKL